VKSCAHCQTSFQPQRMGQRVCSPICAARLVKSNKKAERVQTQARKEAIEPIKKVKAAAQAAFNAYIRARDADEACISCDVINPPMKPGGAWDAGHFMSRGAYPELAFDEDNCHKQCKSCNAGSGKFSHHARTVADQYEERLIKRIGQERVDRLKGPHEVLKLDRDTLRQIKTIYRAKTRQLKQRQE
jgi:hypothetical protein